MARRGEMPKETSPSGRCTHRAVWRQRIPGVQWVFWCGRCGAISYKTRDAGDRELNVWQAPRLAKDLARRWGGEVPPRRHWDD